MESLSLGSLLAVGTGLRNAFTGGNVLGLRDVLKQLRGILDQVNLVKLLSDLQELVALLVKLGWLPPAEAAASSNMSQALLEASVSEAFSRAEDGTISAQAIDLALLMKIVQTLMQLAELFGLKLPQPGEGIVPLSAGEPATAGAAQGSDEAAAAPPHSGKRGGK